MIRGRPFIASQMARMLIAQGVKAEVRNRAKHQQRRGAPNERCCDTINPPSLRRVWRQRMQAQDVSNSWISQSVSQVVLPTSYQDPTPKQWSMDALKCGIWALMQRWDNQLHFDTYTTIYDS